MSGGGKGGSQTTQVSIPPWLEQAARRNIAKAEEISQTGFVPYMGPDVAAFTPMQQASFMNTGSAAQAFGLAAPENPVVGMPQAQNFGGVSAYSSYPLYSQSLANLQAIAPAQLAALRAPFINPQTGAAPNSPYMTGAQQAAAAAANAPAAPRQLTPWEQENMFVGRGGGDY